MTVLDVHYYKVLLILSSFYPHFISSLQTYLNGSEALGSTAPTSSQTYQCRGLLHVCERKLHVMPGFSCLPGADC